MTIIRVGTTQKYSDGWTSAFGGKKKSAGNGVAATKSAATKATAKSAKTAKTAKASAKKSKPAPKKKAKR